MVSGGKINQLWLPVWPSRLNRHEYDLNKILVACGQINCKNGILVVNVNSKRRERESSNCYHLLLLINKKTIKNIFVQLLTWSVVLRNIACVRCSVVMLVSPVGMSSFYRNMNPNEHRVDPVTWNTIVTINTGTWF